MLAEQVDFVVVGAFALAMHGLPRATGDVDFFVRPSPDNAERVFRALSRFGAPLSSASVRPVDFATPGVVYQMGVPPRRIDVLTQASGVSFDEVWATRIIHDVDGRAVPFIGRDALLRNKMAAARPKDLADAKALEALAQASPSSTKSSR
ncbi:MAG: hypothetical protein JNG84_04735 [Archangium sp.]|nr:hypothetical protein [Archangium sp.]